MLTIVRLDTLLREALLSEPHADRWVIMLHPEDVDTLYKILKPTILFFNEKYEPLSYRGFTIYRDRRQSPGTVTILREVHSGTLY